MFDNAFGLTEGGDFKVAGVRAGKTTTFKVVTVGRAPARGREGRGDRAGARGPAQGRALRDQAAVADRRVLRGLPAGRVGRADPGRRPPARGADQLDDRDRPGERHHAAPLSRAPAPDRRRARRGPRGPAGRPLRRCSAARIRRCGRRARRSRSSGSRRRRSRSSSGTRTPSSARSRTASRTWCRFVHEAGRTAEISASRRAGARRDLPPPPGLPRRARAVHEPPGRPDPGADARAAEPPVGLRRARHLPHAAPPVRAGGHAGVQGARRDVGGREARREGDDPGRQGATPPRQGRARLRQAAPAVPPDDRRPEAGRSSRTSAPARPARPPATRRTRRRTGTGSPAWRRSGTTSSGRR